MRNTKTVAVIFLILGPALLLSSCRKEEPENGHGTLQLVRTMAGGVVLDHNNVIGEVPTHTSIQIEFSGKLDLNSVAGNLELKDALETQVPFSISLTGEDKTIVLDPDSDLLPSTDYTLTIMDDLQGAQGETFPGLTYRFRTMEGLMSIEQISLNGLDFNASGTLKDIDFAALNLVIRFSDPLDPDNYQSFFILSGYPPLEFAISEDNLEVSISNSAELDDYRRYQFMISENLQSDDGYRFGGFAGSFYTSLDTTYKLPGLTDEELLDKVQEQTFRYFYDFAHPASGMARERNTSGEIVTSGGSGFGLMALVVGVERGFITRSQGVERFTRILSFLEECDRFHGAWPHWLNGSTGAVQPFSEKDNGGDLVESAFLVQGLIAVRQYLMEEVPAEKALRDRIDTLWHQVEWDWYTRGGQDLLYWHWSPNYEWEMNMGISGHNETLITYVLAAASPTYPINASAYHMGYARNGSMLNGNVYYGITLPLGSDFGGPLFFTHYSFLGLDPRNLSDNYANYWEQNVNHSLINRAYCIQNPKGYIGYSSQSWGLTASDGNQGYSAHSPANDRGVITPTAAVSSLPYTPEYAMEALRHFYYQLGDRLWGEYGFFDAFNVTEGWWADSYLAIDQGPMVVMIENHRTGLLWDLFMSATEVQAGLTKLGFVYD